MTATVLTFAIGDQEKIEAVALTTDAVVEGLEYLHLTISTLAGANAAKGTIDTNRATAKVFIIDMSCKFYQIY